MTAWMGGEFAGRTDTHICVAESHHCPPETITTLLIGYSLINKNEIKKERKEQVLPCLGKQDAIMPLV